MSRRMDLSDVPLCGRAEVRYRVRFADDTPPWSQMPDRRIVVMGVLPLLLLAQGSLSAQWTNRYPKNVGYAHHVYLEGYELPLLTNGPVDAVATPEGGGLIFATRGWLWRYDFQTRVATRITQGAGVDSRPAISVDGRRLAFVRDDGATTAVIVRDVAGGMEAEVARGMALDPAFARDGESLFYSSVAADGDLDLHRWQVSTSSVERLTSERGLELRPQPVAGGERIVYLSKTRSSGDQVRVRQLRSGEERPVLVGNLLSGTRPAVSPDGRLMAYAWPAANGSELRILNIDRPSAPIVLVANRRGRPLSPSWSHDGRAVFYSEADSLQRVRLWRVSTAGGPPAEVTVARWDWGVPTRRFTVRTLLAGRAAPARLNIIDASGHPVVPERGMSWFDGQNGLHYFYSPGEIELEAPPGEIRIRAVQGLATPLSEESLTLGAETRSTVDVTLVPMWNASAEGWYSGDHHFHLNYGGQFDLSPDALRLPMLGENLDVGSPMLANLHNRFENQEHWGWRSSGTPMIGFAQEVRSHFLGHVGLLGTSELFWPWIWGPGYEIHDRDDRTNSEPLLFARRQGGLGVYVHPTTNPRPFSEAGLAAIPIGLVPDAVQGNIDLLEVVCLWSNEVGTTEIWYRLLNAGLPVAPSAGTDVMADLHRTMAVGTTRVYVRPEGPLNWQSYADALRRGRSFVTTGPLIDFRIQQGARTLRPGDAIPVTRGRVSFSVTVHSALPLDSVSLVINGRTVSWLGRMPDSGVFRGGGTFVPPPGGWIAIRVTGPAVTRWPSMASKVFAHTAPVWVGRPGSTEVGARRAAANDLLRALDNAETRLVAGYGDAPIPGLRAHFDLARQRLDSLAKAR
ncbi:MAG: CehA/McbA family metallohydrolase [Gemmatimonadota bacterium]